MKKLNLLLVLLLLSSISQAQDYWKKISTPTNKDLLSISFGNSSTGYIGGKDSTLLKTTDGGKTWTALHHSGIGYEPRTRDIIDLKFVTASTGYAVLSNKGGTDINGQLYKTTDGGHNWTKEAPLSMSVYKTFFFDEKNGYAIGVSPFSGPTLCKLTFGIWTAVRHLGTGTSYVATAIDFLDNTTGIIGGDLGYVYRTFDGGSTWDTVKTNTDTSINDLHFVNADTIIAASSNIGAAMLISTDKGATWSYDGHSATFHYPDMKAITPSVKDSLIIVGKSITTNKGIIYYFNSGSWMDIADAEQWLNEVTMRNDDAAYIVGDSGLLLSNDEWKLSVTEQPSLLQQLKVYPNPAAGSCYSASAVAHSIVLYDLAGRVVYRDSQPAKKHCLELQQLPKANYILEATGDNGEKTSIPLQLR